MGIYQLLNQTNTRMQGLTYTRNAVQYQLPYDQFFNMVDCIGGWLINNSITKGNRVGILLENSPEWAIIDLACLKIGAVVVPIGVNYSPRAIQSIISDSSMKLLFTDRSIDTSITSIPIDLADKAELNLKHIFSTSCSHPTPTQHDTATICYTSGSTGKPKGVILTHGNLMHNILNVPIDLSDTDRELCFLPLHHMFERTCGSLLGIYKDVEICYADGQQQLLYYLQQYKPTYINTVPRFLEKIYLSVKEIPSLRIMMEDKQYTAIAHKVTSLLGSNLRFILVGGAPVSDEILDFYESIGIPVYQGYGLTETAPIVSTNYYHNNKKGSVGKPIDQVTVRISEHGTLLVQSPGVFIDYTTPGEKEKRMMDDWFDTGDMADIDEQGYIFIKGRMDDLIVMSNGKKVYPEPLEQMLQSQGIECSMILGNSKNFLVALVYSASKTKEEISIIIKQINAQLSSYEQIKKVHCIDEPFSLENGLLTPTQKKRRTHIAKKYQEAIQKMYGD